MVWYYGFVVDTKWLLNAIRFLELVLFVLYTNSRHCPDISYFTKFQDFVSTKSNNLIHPFASSSSACHKIHLSRILVLVVTVLRLDILIHGMVRVATMSLMRVMQLLLYLVRGRGDLRRWGVGLILDVSD